MRKVQYVVVGGKVVDSYSKVLEMGLPYETVLVDYNPNAEAEAEASRRHREAIKRYKEKMRA